MAVKNKVDFDSAVTKITEKCLNREFIVNMFLFLLYSVIVSSVELSISQSSSYFLQTCAQGRTLALNVYYQKLVKSVDFFLK